MKRWLIAIVLLLLPCIALAAWDYQSPSTSGAPLSYANGGNGSALGSLSTWTCTIPDSAAVNTNWCTWKAPNTALVAPTFDTLSVIASTAACSTYPIYEIYDVTQSTASATVTLASGNSNTSTSINAQLSSSTATDVYAIRVQTAGNGCSSTLANEMVTVSASMRF